LREIYNDEHEAFHLVLIAARTSPEKGARGITQSKQRRDQQ
jgi:hypothetical protein